ncbi:MAG TPA: hypothetical protein VI076_05690 [Actinopolymorphaceae bacterium]
MSKPSVPTSRSFPHSRSYQAYRIAVLLTAIGVLAQAITAGLLMSYPGGRALHGASAGFLVLAALAMLVTGILVWRAGGGPGRIALGGLGMLLIVVVQAMLGVAHVKWAHVPLGVLMWGGVLTQVTQLWARPRRTKRDEALATA